MARFKRDVFKDKNCLSWHRVTNECPANPEGKFLKRFPTWKRSKIGELCKFLVLHDREECDNPPSVKQRNDQDDRSGKQKTPKLSTQ